MGPVIDQASFDKIMSYIEIGKEEGKLMVGGEGDSSKGYFVKPTIFADLAPDARLMQEEIFGPVVAFSKAKDFDHALEIANNTDYGLTGAVITNNRAKIEQARRTSTSETFTSTAAVQVPSLDTSRSEDSICPGRIPKQADLIICCFTFKRKQLRKLYKEKRKELLSDRGSILI